MTGMSTPSGRRLLPWIARLMLLLGACWAIPSHAQTPSPMAEWQYAAGMALEPYFIDKPPTWQVQLGMGSGVTPRYEGSSKHNIQSGPLIDIRYKDIAFFSLGEGLGINFLSGKGYRAGAALAFDQGRREVKNLPELGGLGNINPTPELKLFGEYVPIFPLVVRGNVRYGTGGHKGWVSDLGIYMPVTGSKKFFVFVGPSVTFANGEYMQRYFGVSPSQSANSAAGYPVYSAGGGLKAAKYGSNVTWFMTDHWFLQGIMAYEHLYGSAARSPIVESKDQYTASAYVAYSF